MNAYVPPGQTAAPASLTPTRRELLEERASDRAACLVECIAAQDRFRDQIAELFEEIDGVGATLVGRCSEWGYDPGQDRIDAARAANLLLSMARAHVRNALEEMRGL